MCTVCWSHRHHNVSHPQIQLRHERFLKPELLQSHLTPTLYLSLILATLIILHFHGGLHPAMLKFYLRTHAPAFAEIIAEIDHYMRQIHAAMMLTGKILWIFISVPCVRKKIVGISRFAIAAHCKLGRCPQSARRCSDQERCDFTVHWNVMDIWLFGCKITAAPPSPKYSNHGKITASPELTHHRYLITSKYDAMFIVYDLWGMVYRQTKVRES